MPCLTAEDARNLSHHMIVFRNDDAVVDAIPEHLCRCACHLPRGLSRRDEHDAPRRKCMPHERFFHRCIGQNGGERLLNDAVGILAQLHDRPPSYPFSAASVSSAICGAVR